MSPDTKPVPFFDVDADLDNIIAPKSEMPDSEDNQIILCDECSTGNVILVPYQNNTKMICPVCLKLYDPKFEYLKHESKEFTIDDAPESGILSYVDDTTGTKHKKKSTTLSRKTLEDDEMPEYLKKEIETIKERSLMKSKSL